MDVAKESVGRIKALDIEARVIQRSSAIAVENVKQHLGNLRPKYEESKAWADDVRYDQQFLDRNWWQNVDKLELLPANKELRGCLPGAATSADGSLKKFADGGPTLKDFEDAKVTRKASSVATSAAQRFAERADDLETLFEDTAHDAFEIVENFSQGLGLSDSDIGDQAGRLMEEVEVVAKKINADYDHILSLPEAEISMKEMSRTDLLHARNFLPALQQTYADIHQLLLGTVRSKDNVMAAAITYMQKVSTIESMIAQVHSQLANLDLSEEDEEAFTTLNFIMKLPLTYGSLMIECVRRREWTDKIMSDSSSLVEEVAILRDEEINRRKKWAKQMGGAVDLSSIDDMALGIDINVQSRKQKWPSVSRQDIQAFLKALGAAGDYGESFKEELEALVKGLDAPSRQQTKRAKAFKNGSMHDANFGKQSLLLRRDDDAVRSLQSDKSKLEDKLKSSESRIRKLEDILHRQSQSSRPPSSHNFTPGNGLGAERQTTSPVPNPTTPLSKPHDSSSRRSSVSSRKVVVNNDVEEKALTQRVVALESQLTAMQQQAVTKAKAEDDLKSQVQDAVSTKEDLLSNMEAQQREFDAERRLVEQENGKLKVRLEEFEDDMDKMLESREQDLRVHHLEQELEKVRKDAAIEVEKAQGQVEYIKNDYTVQREKSNGLEQQVRDLDEEVANLSTRLQKRDLSAANNHRALRTVMLRLSPDSVAPEDLDSLVETVEELAKQSQEHLMEVEQALRTVRADNAAMEARMKNQSDAIHDLKGKVGTGEIEIFSLREDTAKHRTDLASLQSELETERGEHGQLRTKFAIGETDAESLRGSIAQKEEAVADLNGKITGLQGKIEDLELRAAGDRNRLSTARSTLDQQISNHQIATELQQTDLRDLQAAHDDLVSNLDVRSNQAEEVSARLYTVKNSMGRLLEQIGYTVTKENDILTFQRTSKAQTSSTVLLDPSNSMTRSVSNPTSSKSFFDSKATSHLITWPSSSPTCQPADFASFMSDISSLPTEAFSEAIIKRVKDADHTTRKYFKEARNYRDKYRRVQSEGHDKITIRAFKEGDLVLFLPTRNQVSGLWAAFNINFPHYFLREQENHRLSGKEWLLARITKIETRVVDLSKSMNGLCAPPQQPNSALASGDAASDGGASFEDENPFQLSDGLKWHLVDAVEEKLGAPMMIGSSKSTVAAANVDAQGSMGNKKKGKEDGEGEATAKLRTSLDSRRSSTNSKAGVTSAARPSTATSLEERLAAGEVVAEGAGQLAPVADSTQPKRQSSLRHSTSQEQQAADPVRSDLLWGP